MSLMRVPAKAPVARAIVARPATLTEEEEADTSPASPDPASSPIAADGTEKTVSTSQQAPAGALLTQKQAAALLGVGVGLLRQWRAAGTGPRYSKLSPRVIRYRSDDIREFLSKCTQGGE